MILETITQIDLNILNFIQQYLHFAFLDYLMIFLTNIGYAGAVWFLTAIILIISKKHRRTGLFLFFAILTMVVIGEYGLKNLVARVRPCHTYPIDNMLIKLPHSFSFPSGHTSVSFTAAVFLGYIYKNYRIPLLLFAVLISFSRLYLYVHYPTDILGGIIIGSLVGWIWYKLYQKERFIQIKMPQKLK